MAKQDSLQGGAEVQRHSKHTEVNVSSFFRRSSQHLGMLQISPAACIAAVRKAVFKGFIIYFIDRCGKIFYACYFCGCFEMPQCGIHTLRSSTGIEDICFHERRKCFTF